jgi:putative Mg2+ transporter-C (MgtC) family protein
VNDLIVDAFRLDLAAKLIAAILIGGGIGLERELKGKPAGLRTNILICVGSALLMDLSMNLAAVHGGDPGRIAAQVVTGIGFLGAGTILHTRGQITGLTSAATIWVVAALGLTIGAGYFIEALGSTVTVMIVLVGLGWVERRYLNDAQEAAREVAAPFAQPRAQAGRDGDHRAGGRRATDRRGLPAREPTGDFPVVDTDASSTRRTDGGT